MVTAFLDMSDRGTEEGWPVLLGNGKQGNLAIEVDELLDNHLLDVATATFTSVFPSMTEVVSCLD